MSTMAVLVSHDVGCEMWLKIFCNPFIYNCAIHQTGSLFGYLSHCRCIVVVAFFKTTFKEFRICLTA